MLIGYARVSTDEQDTTAQVAELKAAGCERIYREKASAGGGTGQNFTGFWINCARVMCSLSGSSTGSRVPSATFSQLWSGLGSRRGISQLDGSHRYHHSSRTHDDADGRGVC